MTPFSNPNKSLIYKQILNKELTFPDYCKVGIKISADAIDIIRKLLVKDPKSRLGSKGDECEILSHSFYSSISKEKILKKEVMAL